MNISSSAPASAATPAVALFADVQNLYYTSRDVHGRAPDYRALWRHACRSERVAMANAYAIERHDARQQQFQNALRQIGFNVRLKPFIQRRDGSAKGDWDVGITLDMIEAAECAERLVLMSGDGDFVELIERLHRRFGVIVEVYAVEALTARALINAADRFYPIDDRFLIAERRQ
ncbi:LabA-like NYN domain-containing protein [Kushneria aurantia]|uniref:NYN domain-containing protein n=1 Tax=Kushneria aurantia TaxID=504092 RepID=A0ABV6FYH6_9GAMM|nr:NYN domain-containing protein [Kushneria aurantia]